MEIVFRISLLLAGAINTLPALLVFIPQKISTSYGINVPDANYELILRHRAVLFGIVGGLMIFSALTKKYYEVATLAGFVSMLSFVFLYFMIGGVNEPLRKVMIVDVVASIILLIGTVVYWSK